MKKKVKFLESIAGLADPDRQKLDRKYKEILDAAQLKKDDADAKGAKFNMAAVHRAIQQSKMADRYADVQRGFERDFAFKSGEEAFVPADVAQKWEAAGICQILEDGMRAA